MPQLGQIQNPLEMVNNLERKIEKINTELCWKSSYWNCLFFNFILNQSDFIYVSGGNDSGFENVLSKWQC